MSTTANTSQGVQLKVTISSTPVLIPQCTDYPIPFGQQDFDEITNLDSAGGYKEWFPTLKDGSELAVNFIYNANDTTHQYLQTSFLTVPSPLESFSISLVGTGSHVVSFHGYVAKWEPKVEKGKAVRGSFSIKISGAVAFA